MSKIIVVDDVYAELQLIESYLKSANHTVVSYLSAEKLEEKLLTDNPDLILLDGVLGRRQELPRSRHVVEAGGDARRRDGPDDPPPDGQLAVHLAQPFGQAPLAPQVERRAVGGEQVDRKSTRLNSSHIQKSRMPSSA